jgi:hypothetical protein
VAPTALRRGISLTAGTRPREDAEMILCDATGGVFDEPARTIA